MSKKVIMDKIEIKRAVARLSQEILERKKDVGSLVILGIPTRGFYLAKRVVQKIEEISGMSVPAGAVDATLYRDDIGLTTEAHALKETEIPTAIDGKVVVMVDDVLFTGRTVRAALNALMDYGRPRVVQLAVLVERGHRELPIKADYVGKNIPTSTEDDVKVFLEEVDEKSEVTISQGK